MSELEQLKGKKDATQLVSALYSLSKAAKEASDATIDFFEAFPSQAGDLDDLHATLAALGGFVDKAKLVKEEGEDKQAPRKRKRAKPKPVDPNAPKKPHTVYFAFLQHARKTLPEERKRLGLSPLSSSEMTKTLSEKWHQLTDDEKRPWKERYDAEMAEYSKKKKEYTAKLAAEAAALAEAPIANGDEEHEEHSEHSEHSEHEDEEADEPESADSDDSAKDKKRKKDSKEPEKEIKKEKKERRKKRKGEALAA